MSGYKTTLIKRKGLIIKPFFIVCLEQFVSNLTDSTTGVDLEITGGLVTKDSLLASVARARKKLADPDTGV